MKCLPLNLRSGPHSTAPLKHIMDENNPLKHVQSRWTSLAAGCLLIVCSGSVYGFGGISQKVKSNLEISEHQLGLIALSGNVGLALGNVIGGSIADSRGPRLTLLCGSLLFLVGYGGMYLALSSVVDVLRTPSLVAALWLVSGTGSGFVYNATVFTNSRNFSTEMRGAIVGIIAALFGASSTIWITVLNGCLGGSPVKGSASAATFICGNGWIGGDMPSFLLFLAIVLPLLTLLGMTLTFRIPESAHREIGHAEPDTVVRYRVKLISASVLALLAAAGAAAVITVALDGNKAAIYVREVSPVIILMVLLLVVLLTASMGVTKSAPPEGTLMSMGESDAVPSTLIPAAMASSPRDALQRIEFWLLFLLYFVVAGGNITTMNMLSTILSDRNVGDAVVASIAALLVMLVSSVARFIGGWIISMAPTPAMAMRLLVMSAAFAVIGQVLFSLDSSIALFLGVPAIGCSDGFFWTSLPVASIRIFGAKHSGSIFGMVMCFGTIGIVLISYGVQPAVYDAHMHPGDTECLEGIACFAVYHLICAGFAGVGLAGAVAGVMKVRHKSPQCQTEPCR